MTDTGKIRIKLEALFFGHDPETAVFECDSCEFHDAVTRLTTGAGGDSMLSIIEPAYLAARGMPSNFDPNVGWNRVTCASAGVEYAQTSVRAWSKDEVHFVLH